MRTTAPDNCHLKQLSRRTTVTYKTTATRDNLNCLGSLSLKAYKLCNALLLMLKILQSRIHATIVFSQEASHQR